MAKCIETNQIGTNYKRIAKQMRYASWLLKELEKGDSEQCPEEYLKFQQKWGEVDFSSGRLRFNLVKTKEDEEQSNKEFHELVSLQNKRYEDKKRRLFRHIEKYIEHWWD